MTGAPRLGIILRMYAADTRVIRTILLFALALTCVLGAPLTAHVLAAHATSVDHAAQHPGGHAPCVVAMADDDHHHHVVFNLTTGTVPSGPRLVSPPHSVCLRPGDWTTHGETLSVRSTRGAHPESGPPSFQKISILRI